jgi:hypothetical protein
MKTTFLLATLVVAYIASAGTGYWFGFREGWWLGRLDDELPRGTIALAQLKAVKAGESNLLETDLEFEIDDGLLGAHELMNHPLRNALEPIWGLGCSDCGQYVVRLSNYRKLNPSLMKPDMFDVVPPGKEQDREWYQDVAHGVRENLTIINSMVDQYASKQQ